MAKGLLNFCLNGGEMEYHDKGRSYLLVKIACEDPTEYNSIGKHLPLVQSYYDSKRKILALLFHEHDIDSLLISFMKLFPEAQVLETGLSGDRLLRGYVRKFSDQISIVSPGPGIKPIDEQIIIHSSLAFGSGFHPSTELSIRLLERAFSVKRPEMVFDLGTGSGILALAAAKLGAAHILAVDIDLRACAEARENIVVNDFQDKIWLVCGSYSCARQGVFDLLVANLTISTLVTLARFLPPLLAPHGLIVFSGFTKEQSAQVVSASGGGQVLEELDLEGWAGLLIRPNP